MPSDHPYAGRRRVPVRDHALLVAAVALLLLAVSGSVRGAMGDLMAEVAAAAGPLH